MIKISAIILNYNSSGDCDKCIQFLKEQDYPLSDILVVDNNSSNADEIEKLKVISATQDAELLINKENLGFSAGNNIGLREAAKKGAEWCLVINPDVELRDKNYIAHMLEKIQQYENVAVAASSVKMPDGELQNPQRESKFIDDFLWPLQYVRKREKDSNWNVGKQITGYCEKVSGCCFFVKTSFLESINFLDETTFLYCEEAILAKQVLNSGNKILYVHDCVANHEHFKKEKSSPKKRMKIFLKSRRYYLRNYSGYGFIKRNLSIFSNKIEELLLTH